MDDNKPKFTPVPAEKILWMQSRGLSPVLCHGCREVILAVKDIHAKNYCDECERKRTQFEKYEDSVESIGHDERMKVLHGNTKRQGPFWSPATAKNFEHGQVKKSGDLLYG